MMIDAKSLVERTQGRVSTVIWLVALSPLWMVAPVRADVIGLADPLDMPALLQNSRLIYGPGGVNLSGNPINFTDTSVFGGTATALIAGTTFTGSIDAPNTADGAFVQAGSFWRDQLYVTSADGSPISVAFDFTISYHLTSHGGYGSFYLAMDNSWANALYPDITYAVYSESTVMLNEGAGAFVTSVRTNDLDPGLLVGDGLYLPFSLGMYGRISDATLDWSQTILLTGIRAFDQSGNQLSPDQFTASFVSGLQVPGVSVPEPSALGLLTVGLVVSAWRRRRARASPASTARGKDRGGDRA